MGEALTPLGNFIKKLATDPKALRSYRRNPETALKAAGLSRVEVAAMKSKDPGRIRAALGGGDDPGQLGLAIINAIVLVL
jgi:hypothetical protein